MRYIWILICLIGCQYSKNMGQDYFKDLTEAEKRIIVDKGTEAPFTGKYNDFYEPGVFVCRACEQPLYESSDKFNSGCGWPSFDKVKEGSVNRLIDISLGHQRIEIVCSNCEGHLGHVFEGENLTPENTRHCVNSLSIRFLPNSSLSVATFAAGCFWGVEELYRKLPGVYSTAVGYVGGRLEDPTYEAVCTGSTGHAEVVQIYFKKNEISYDALLDVFWKNHNPTTLNRQGPDIGTQYRSAIFYHSENQKELAVKSKQQLESDQIYKNAIVTEITAFDTFYRAEEYHQDYLYKRGLGSCKF